MNNNKTILIYAHNTMGDPITNLKDYLQLHLQTLLGEEMVILSCNEERSNGIYAFHIEDSQCLFARVFVRLSQDVTQGNITYYKIPYSLHPTCHQINILACMLDNTEAISYTFDSYPQTFIGIIKAYKKDKQQDNDNALSNPHNEIYTLDTEQEIQLKAFIYEAQKTYMPLKEITNKKTQIKQKHDFQKGNITKNIISPPPMVSLNIRWAFKIVNNTYMQGRKVAFPLLKKEQDFIILEHTDTLCTSDSKEASQGTPKLTSIPQGYVEIVNKKGDTLDFKLSDIFSKELLEENTNKTKTLIDKNIIFFAYDENVGINTDTDTNTNAYRVYQEYDKNINNRIISQDRVTSIELKILKTRLSLEFDGEYLRLYENQREIEYKEIKSNGQESKQLCQWEARSGKAIKHTQTIPQSSKAQIEKTEAEIQAKNRTKIPYNQDYSFYYDTDIQTDTSNLTRPLQENKANTTYYVKIPKDFISNTNISTLDIYTDKTLTQMIAQINQEPFKTDDEKNNNTNTNTNINAPAFVKLLREYFNAYKILLSDDYSIPLKVQYQKRVVITIERFKQTTESTLARMNIFIDRKRVDTKGKIIGEQTKQYEYLDLHSLPKDNPYAYILERPGPDCIAGKVKLRIPEGRYNVLWRNAGGRRKEVLQLYNDFVHQNRAILIHEGYTLDNTNEQAQGTSPRNTFGCLVIAKERVKDKNNSDEFADNILGADSSKKKDLANIIKEVNGLSQYLFDDDTRAKLKSDDARAKAVVKHIEIRIKNNFKQTKAKEQEETLPPNIIRIETEDESEDFIEIELPKEQENDTNTEEENNWLDTTLDYIDKVGDIPVPIPYAKLFKIPKLAKSSFKIAKNALKAKSLTREEVISLLKNKYGLKKSKGGAYMAKDNKQIKEIWEEITQGAEILKDGGPDSFGEMIKMVKLSDGTIIKLRKKSKSRGSTIETDKPKQIKIHNEAKEDGDW